MSRDFIRCLFCAAAVHATPLLAATPEPADAAAPVPAAEYQSVFSSYRRYADESAADWRAVNEEVGRVGGHRGVVGGASGHAGHAQPKPVQPTGEAPPAPPQPPVRGAPKAAAEHGHTSTHRE